MQEFVTFAQALAYTNFTDENFNKDIKPYVRKYRRNKDDIQYFIPELRERVRELEVCGACKYE